MGRGPGEVAHPGSEGGVVAVVEGAEKGKCQSLSHLCSLPPCIIGHSGVKVESQERNMMRMHTIFTPLTSNTLQEANLPHICGPCLRFQYEKVCGSKQDPHT